MARGWLGLEVSRLARNNADWHRLLEICALADTLILDEDGVYDPANFNCPLPTGFIYDEVGDVVLDPDAQIREMITHFFETFTCAGVTATNGRSESKGSYRSEGGRSAWEPVEFEPAPCRSKAPSNPTSESVPIGQLQVVLARSDHQF